MNFPLKNILSAFLLAFCVFAAGCSKDETYAKKKKREMENIDNFIRENGITTISIAVYLEKGYTLNPENYPDSMKNEYICFTDKNVYMQIINVGQGDTLREGERKNYTVRFVEYNIQSKDTILYNIYESVPDCLTISLSEGVYSATFTSGVMYNAYGASVPTGWLIPFEFTTPGFYNSRAAHVKLILPHNEGSTTAAANVYPAYYELFISPEKWQ